MELSEWFGLDDLVDRFYNIVFNEFDDFIPKTQKKVYNHPPWLSKELLSLKIVRAKNTKFF